jgi:hypothetical protein
MSAFSAFQFMYFCSMLNIGLIGNSQAIEKQAETLKKYPDIKIQGKASAGTKDGRSEYDFSIPEYNRVELIERCDAVILEDSAHIPYSLLLDALKRNKHFFFFGYPDFSEIQCQELSKLIDEAGTIVQITNPLFYHTPVQCMVHHTTRPFFLSVDIGKPYTLCSQPILWDILLLVTQMGQNLPKKIKTFYVEHKEKAYRFLNIRTEYSDSSVLDLNLTLEDKNEKYQMRMVSEKNYFDLNLITHQLTGKIRTAHTKKSEIVKEYESFFKAIIKQQPPSTGINEYFDVLRVVDEINGKLSGYSL